MQSLIKRSKFLLQRYKFQIKRYNFLLQRCKFLLQRSKLQVKRCKLLLYWCKLLLHWCKLLIKEELLLQSCKLLFHPFRHPENSRTKNLYKKDTSYMNNPIYIYIHKNSFHIPYMKVDIIGCYCRCRRRESEWIKRN